MSDAKIRRKSKVLYGELWERSIDCGTDLSRSTQWQQFEGL
jgi:hypothetical protein